MSGIKDILCVDDEFDTKLGTKEHWDTTYEEELELLKNEGAIGHVWFEDKAERIFDWMIELPGFEKSSSFIDVGCGNGATLVDLAKMGYENLVGTDYSDNAIEVARVGYFTDHTIYNKKYTKLFIFLMVSYMQKMKKWGIKLNIL